MKPINAESILGNHPFGYLNDGEPAKNDPFTIEEAIAVVDFHAAKQAQLGNYGTAEDLMEVSKVLERIAEGGKP